MLCRIFYSSIFMLLYKTSGRKEKESTKQQEQQLKP